MANVYTSKVAATVANRTAVYRALSVFALHLPNLGVDLVSLSRDANNFIIVTVSGPIAAAQLDHFGLA